MKTVIQFLAVLFRKKCQASCAVGHCQKKTWRGANNVALANVDPVAMNAVLSRPSACPRADPFVFSSAPLPESFQPGRRENNFLADRGLNGPSLRVLAARLLCHICVCLTVLPARAAAETGMPGQLQKAISFAQIGVEVEKQYHGDGIAVIPTRQGARLKAAFQKLEADATAEGLWVVSTEEPHQPDRLRVRARSVGRVMPGSQPTPVRTLAAQGEVRAAPEAVAWMRPGVVEEYSTGMDGIRQDFLVLQRPEGGGELCLMLEVDGARVSAARDGVQLTLHTTGRELAYSRLHVTDAHGRELPARMEPAGAGHLRILVDDHEAAFPVRIDPTFSDADWIGMATGADNNIHAMAFDSSGNLVVGGRFTSIAGIAANRIAMWNGSEWRPLGSGVNDVVDVLLPVGADILVGGDFTVAGGVTVNRIARWNGSAWSALGTGVNSTVRAIVTAGADIIVGGAFTTAGGGAANRVARWNGTAWSALGAGVDSNLHALAVVGTDLYAGGYFVNAGGASANHIAKWDGTAWSSLGTGMDQVVESILPSGSDLLVAGAFTTAGGVTVNRVARWNGISWSALGEGMNNTVTTLRQAGSDLYACGYFTTAGGVTANRIARWDGTEWHPVGTGMNSPVFTILISGSTIYAGGTFGTAGGVPVNRLAKWDGAAWSGFGSGMNGSVRALALAVAGTELYAGGEFTTAGGVTVNRIAKWTGSGWAALGSGMNGTVRALVVSGTDLYAGGEFTTAGGVSANRIAKWNGSEWTALGSGMNSRVLALAVSGTNLYAGGEFTTAGGVSANFIAKWNGSGWSALGSGMSQIVMALAVSGANLYAGGNFTVAGGVSANYIAKWDGSGWTALGTGVISAVYALAVSGADLYAGGAFTTAGGTPANYIAKWNGSAWTQLGSGMNSLVVALAVSGIDLYAGGSFFTAGGVTAFRIARWDGSAWSPLGSGTNSNVYALARLGANLFVGGEFTTAGGKTSERIARANLSRLAVEQPAGNLIASGRTLDFGATSLGSAMAPRLFTIRNVSVQAVGDLAMSLAGANAGDYVLNTAGTAAALAPDEETTFTLHFAPGGAVSGTRTAAVQIFSDDPVSPFVIHLSGLGLSKTADADGDGLNDWAEFQLAALGFNWQANQSALVTALFDGANSAGLFTEAQIQALYVNTPQLERNPDTGYFSLTIGVEKSTDLVEFTPFPMTAPQIMLDDQGRLKFQFTVPENAAFIMLRAQ